MHSFLSRKNQPYHLSEYEIFVAEVASTVHEELLTHFLKNEKIDLTYLIVEQIEQIRATFFRQTLFADFELFLHTSAEKGVPLTSDLLETTYLELNKKYYGPDLHCTKELGCEWARIPHFYYNFYVYQYATGISAAHALKEGFTTQGKKGIDRYLNFLSSGSSASPVKLLQKAGVDLTTCTPFIQLIQTFDTLVKSLEIKNLALK